MAATREHKRAYIVRLKAKGLTRKGAVRLEPHPFEHSDWFSLGPSGTRFMELCAECGRSGTGRQHLGQRVRDTRAEANLRYARLHKLPALTPAEWKELLAERAHAAAYTKHRGYRQRHPDRPPRVRLTKDQLRIKRNARILRWRHAHPELRRRYNRGGHEREKLMKLMAVDAPPEIVAVAHQLRALRVALYQYRTTGRER